MSNDGKTCADVDHTGSALLYFENKCYFKLIEQIITVFNLEERPIIYGNEYGLNAYLSCGLQLDLSVLIYESAKHTHLISPQGISDFISTEEFKILEKVRNNVHTFFKKGGFASKSDEIIDSNLEKYRLKEYDVFYSLRNDISLVFEILGHKRQLIGSDYFIQHCLFECNGQKWKGNDYINFSAYLSSSVKRFADTVDETAYRLHPLSLNKEQPRIELFDYKSADLFAGSKLSNAISFRLMLILFQISYGTILVEEVLSHESYACDNLWICFFTKLLAIKYDESIDNMSSLLKYASEEDKSILTTNLLSFNFDINNLAAREFARSLRNTIHYQSIKFDPSLLTEKTTRSYILAIYLSNTAVKTIDEFKGYAQKMFSEMKTLQAVIRKIMGVDKEYDF